MDYEEAVELRSQYLGGGGRLEESHGRTQASLRLRVKLGASKAGHSVAVVPDSSL